MNLLKSPFVRPLDMAENQFLQALVTEFTLRRSGQGNELDLHVPADAPAIWLRRGCTEVRERMIRAGAFDRKRVAYQKALDTFLVRRRGKSYRHDDDDFPFRYASGGALPVLRMGDKDYYALFYREIFPVGWNLANGYCDSRHELLNPLDAVERELREELIIADPPRRRLYAFEGDAGRWLQLPECALARRLWLDRFRAMGYDGFLDRETPLKWLEGPDTLRVALGDEVAETTGCFLNINADDFGIEIDRAAKINLDPEVVLCDGEIIGGKLLDRIVGLFPVDQVNRDVARGVKEFLPERFFRGGLRYGGDRFQEVLGEYMRSPPVAGSARSRQEWEAARDRFDLCPATRGSIQRYRLLEAAAPKAAKPSAGKGACRVFVSFGHEDRDLAAAVYEFLRRKKRKDVFFSEKTLYSYNYSRMIDEALDAAHCLIAVGTHPDHLTREWPQYEWRSFHNDILTGRKPQSAQLLSFIAGFGPADLPRPLCHCQAVQADRQNPQPGLEQLARFVP